MPPDYQASPQRVSTPRVFVLIVLLVGLVLLIWLVFFHHTSTSVAPSHTPNTTTPQAHKPSRPNSSKIAKSPAESQPSEQTQASPPSQTGSSPVTPKLNPTPAPSAAGPGSATKRQQLTNTGPSSTVPLFLGASLLGTTISYLYLRRRQEASE